MGQMRLRRLSEANDVQIRFGQALLSKTLTDGRNMIDVIPTLMWNLSFSFLSNAIRSLASKGNYFAFLSSAGEMDPTSGSGMQGQSFKIMLPVVGWIVIVGYSTSGPRHLVFLDLFSWSFLDPARRLEGV